MIRKVQSFKGKFFSFPTGENVCIRTLSQIIIKKVELKCGISKQLRY